MLKEIKFSFIKKRRPFTKSLFLRFCKAFLLLAFFALAAFAQGKGSSVLLYNKAAAGTEANTVAEYLENQIGKGLLDKYPCVDWIDEDSLGALLEWESWRQILGQDPNDELMQNLGGAVGANYIVVVTATTLPNGQTTVSAKVLDSKTGNAVANEMETGANAEAALDNAESVAQKILQDLKNFLKSQCEAHWTGTITYTFEYRKGETKTADGIPGAMESNVKLNISWSDKMENTIEALLQPMSGQTEGAKTPAGVSHKYLRQYNYAATRTGEVICRPKNQNSYKKSTSGNTNEIIEERGQKTEMLPVYIYVEKETGKYEISVNYPAITTKRHEERNGIKSGCENIPFSDSNDTDDSAESEPYRQSGYFEARGQIDPKNPNVLSGKEVTGNLEDGQYTMIWNLRLVKPQTKK